MPAVPSTNTRPLLRLHSSEDFTAQRIAEYGYGGVIFDTVSPPSEIFLQCRAENLEAWLDISDVAFGNRPELQRWELRFEQSQPLFERSVSTLLDPFHPESADAIIELLARFDTTPLAGVLCDWNRRGPATSLFPSFPWSSQMVDRFDAGKLEALIANTGAEAARFRQKYWKTLSLLSGQNIERVRSACESRNLQFKVREFSPEWEVLQLDNTLRARLDSRSRNDWPQLLQGDSPAAMLRNFYRFTHAGAARFQVKGSPHSFTSAAKLINKAIATGSAKIAASKNAARVGVLFPGRSCRTHYHPDGHRLTRWVGDDLKRIASLLDDLHFDWVFVREGELAKRLQELAMIVMPSVTALATTTWQTLEDFVENGGNIACLGLLPRWSENGRDKGFEERVGKAALVSVEDLYSAYAALENATPIPSTIGFPIFREHRSGGRLCCYQPRLNQDAEDARLRVHQILHESLAPDFETQTREILYAHRICTGEETADEFFVFNTSTEPQHVNARFRPEIDWFSEIEIASTDLATGEARRLYSWMPHPIEQGGGLSMSLDLAAAEARFITIKDVTGKDQQPTIERASFEVESFDGKVATGYATESGIQKLALRRDKKLQWHESEFVAVPTPLLLDDWNEITNVNSTEYSRRITLPEEWLGCRVFLEIARHDALIKVVVNGKNCGERFSLPLRFEITSAVKFGDENLLEIQSTPCPEEVLARLTAYPNIEIDC